MNKERSSADTYSMCIVAISQALVKRDKELRDT